jgi:lysozyme family protein
VTAFDTCLAFTLGQEGGAVNNPHDPGGFTFRGVTLATYQQWTGNQDATSDDLLAISDDALAALYGALYWNPVRGDALPPAVAMLVFDFAVNASVRTSAQTLQHAVGAAEDGSIGPMTLAAVASDNVTFLVGRLAQLRADYYRSLTALFPTFGRGWIARTDACEAAAMLLLPAHVSAA